MGTVSSDLRDGIEGQEGDADLPRRHASLLMKGNMERECLLSPQRLGEDRLDCLSIVQLMP